MISFIETYRLLTWDSCRNLKASWLFPDPPRPYNTKTRWIPPSESKYLCNLSRISFRPVNEATGSGQSLHSLTCCIDSTGRPGETGATMNYYAFSNSQERYFRTELLHSYLHSRNADCVHQQGELFINLFLL